MRAPSIAAFVGIALVGAAHAQSNPYFRYGTSTPTSAGPQAATPGASSNGEPPQAQAAVPSMATSSVLVSQAGAETAGACTNVEVTNAGGRALSDLSYSVAPTTDFAACPGTQAASVPACGSSLPPYARCNVGVRLATGTAGLRNGTLTLSTSNGTPKSVSSAISGTYAGPAYTANNTQPISDSPGSSYEFGDNSGGPVVPKYLDNSVNTYLGVSKGGYTGLLYPRAVAMTQVDFSIGLGAYSWYASNYYSGCISFYVSYRDESGAWTSMPSDQVCSQTAYPYGGAYGRTVSLGNVRATEVRLNFFNAGQYVYTGVVQTLRPSY